MLPKVCSTVTAMDKEKAATSLLKYDEHLRDWEGRRLSCWSSGGDLDNFGGCLRPPDKRGKSRKQWQGIADEETKGTVGSGKDTMCRKQEMLLSWRMLVSAPAEVKKVCKRGAEKAPRSWTRHSENEQKPDSKNSALIPKSSQNEESREVHLSPCAFGVDYCNDFKAIDEFRTCCKPQISVCSSKTVTCMVRALEKGSFR